MRVKHHFCCDSSRSLTDALERNGIPYAHDVWDGIRPETVTFDLYEDSTAFGEITVLAGSGDIQIREYTEQELLDAEWLTMRCFHPTLDLVREDEAFAFSEPFGDGKYRHRELVGTTFYLKKPVKWGKGISYPTVLWGISISFATHSPDPHWKTRTCRCGFMTCSMPKQRCPSEMFSMLSFWMSCRRRPSSSAEEKKNLYAKAVEKSSIRLTACIC